MWRRPQWHQAFACIIQQLQSAARETVRSTVSCLGLPPDITACTFGWTGLPASRPAAAPVPVGTQWENLAQLIARSVALRQHTTTGTPQTSIVAAEPIHNEAPRAVDDYQFHWDLVPVPDDGHFPMYEADMELAHLNLREERSSSSDTHRRPWRLRDDVGMSSQHVDNTCNSGFNYVCVNTLV